MTTRIGLVIAALIAAGLIAGAVLYRRLRSQSDGITDRADDEVASSVAEEPAPTEAEPAPV
jgi:hypothetical protein